MEKTIIYMVGAITPHHLTEKRCEGRVDLHAVGSDLDAVLAKCEKQLNDQAGKWVTDYFKNPNLQLAKRITDLTNWSAEKDWTTENKYGDRGFIILTEREIGDEVIMYGLKKIELSGTVLEMCREKLENESA